MSSWAQSVIEVKVDHSQSHIKVLSVGTGLRQATRDMMYWLYDTLSDGTLPDMHPRMMEPNLTATIDCKRSIRNKNEFQLARTLLKTCEMHNGRLKNIYVGYADPASLEWAWLRLRVEVTGPPSRNFSNGPPVDYLGFFI